MPDEKKPKERAELVRWYEANRATPFHLRQALLDYCRNDVAILREASLAFRRIFLDPEVAGVDPFRVAPTLAKLSLHVYRLKHLPASTMVNAPERGYRFAAMQSHIALKYFRLYEREHNCSVQTSLWSVGEARVDDTGYRLDGLVRFDDGRLPLALEFLGCLYHGGW